MNRDTPKARLQDDASATHAGSVYYRQAPAPRKRRQAAPANRAVSPSAPAPRRASGNIGHAIMLSNIRTFMLVLLFMLGLLGLAVYLTGKAWQSRQDSVAASPAPRRTPPPPPTDPASLGVLMDTPQDAAPQLARVRTELDTDAMRRAIFMQKRAEALVHAGNHQEAIARFRDALEIWPYLTQVWAQLGRTYLDIRDYPRAAVALERAVEADPGSAELLNDLGVAFLFQNRVDRAKDLFETVIDLTPGFAPAHFNRSLCHLATNDEENAEIALDAFLRLRPNDPQGLKEKAYLQASRGEYEEALTSLRRALTSAPDWVPLYIDAAAAAALLGRADDAIRYLDRAEAFTSPSVVYRIYQQPAFREVRMSEPGRVFEISLAERARKILAAQEGDDDPISLSMPMQSENP